MPERFLRRNFCSDKIPFDILLYRGLFIAPRYIGKTDKTPFPKRPPQPCRRIGTVQKTHGTTLFDFINNVTHAHVDGSEKGKSEIAATLRKPLKTNRYRAFDRFTRFCTSESDRNGRTYGHSVGRAKRRKHTLSTSRSARQRKNR